jgi:hypothetical protein
VPGLGPPRDGCCWYCGNTSLREDDPPEHIVPAAIGGTLVTNKVCFACNQRASREVDQRFLGEWSVLLARREQMILGRRGERPPKLPQRATLEDGTRVEVDVWGGSWETRPQPIVERIGEEYHVRAADEEEVQRIKRDLEHKAADRGETLIAGEPLLRGLPSTVKVSFTFRPNVWLRMTAKMALGTASLVWDDSWLSTPPGRELIATLWDPDPRTPEGQPAGLIPIRPKGPLKHFCEPPEHLLFFTGGSDQSKFVAILLGSEVVGLPLMRNDQPHPQTAWLMDGLGGSARKLPFDELAMTAAQRAGLIPNADEAG